MAKLSESIIYEILSVVEEIPEGRVATYGQIARLIGKEKNSRLVGRVLKTSSMYGQFPCHRVVNHAGRLVPGWFEQEDMQYSTDGFTVNVLAQAIQSANTGDTAKTAFLNWLDDYNA